MFYKLINRISVLIFGQVLRTGTEEAKQRRNEYCKFHVFDFIGQICANNGRDKNHLHQPVLILDQWENSISSRKDYHCCNGYYKMELVLLF